MEKSREENGEMIPAELAPLMRGDGSLRYDIVCGKSLEGVLPTTMHGDPAIRVMMELAESGMFHPLCEVFGNIGLERFIDARKAIQDASADPRLSASPYGPAIRYALQQTVQSMKDREPKARAAEHLIAQSDAIDQLSRELLNLESRCATTGESRRRQLSCRQEYWRLWELAWAVRIFSPEERVIESLEKMYARYPCLELREGERRKLQLPGGLRDPRLQEEGAVELW
ncbi:MAG: hypothetical protein G8237_01370 [Magnetococcales bacterium]|nr:hypothetical protein [Magnetococcales bacterium]NGZ04987.1 hypothetical protein [Magnetococcales bacterium]